MARGGRPTDEEMRRAIEDSEEGESEKVGLPRGIPEPGEVVVGRFDAGPTGERGGYREATPGGRIGAVAIGVLIVIVVMLALVFMR